MRALALLALLALGGCTHGRAVRTPDDVAALNRRVEGRRVVLLLADGRRLGAEGLRVEGDSASWVDPASRLVGRAGTADLRGVLVDGGRIRGLAEGTVLGVAGAALVGAGIGYVGNDCFFDPCPRTESAREGALLFGFLGSGLGAAVGLLRGSPTLYRLPPSSD